MQQYWQTFTFKQLNGDILGKSTYFTEETATKADGVMSAFCFEQ